MKVSVILASHNKWGYVDEAIKSILSQTYPVFEIILIDSGALGKHYFDEHGFNDFRLKYVLSGEDPAWRTQRCMHAWCINECFRRGLVTGDLICYLSDDDVYYPMAFAAFVWAAEKCPEQSAWYAAVDVFNNNKPTERFESKEMFYRGKSPDCLVDGMQVCHRTGLKVPWPEEAKYLAHNDGVFLERLAEKAPVLWPLPFTCGAKRHTPLSTFAKAKE